MEVDKDGALDVATDLASSCAALLGSRLVAVILHGSLALGAYRPQSSDIDLLAVVEDASSDGELDALEQLVGGHVAAPRIDFRVVTRMAAAVPTISPAMELYVGRHSGGTEVRTRGTERDLLSEFSMVRAFGRNLIGAQPARVCAPVPDAWIDSYGDEIVARWQQLTDDAENAVLMVLTSCRIWRYTVERVYCSKLDAGRWALDRAPRLTAVAAALRDQDGGTSVQIAPGEVGDLLAEARRELAR